MPAVKELVQKQPASPIGRAYQFAKRAHSEQKRKSGEPYFNHVMATAEILQEWQMDEETVAAGLLHDTVEDTGTPLSVINKEFGEEIAFLVDGVTKLGKIKYRGVEAKAENLRKMILALSKDLRVIFIKFADRLHNMRTLNHLPPQKQKRIAMETDEIYAPLAYRLGMQNLSGELKDLAFPYIYPQEHRWLKKNVKEKYDARHDYLAKIKPQVEEALKTHGIEFSGIDFRAKRHSSLYQKLLRYEMDADRIYDLVAMRIIVKTVEECYAALGIIHQLWPPLPGRIKDYIAMPKPNGYRSLHTTIIGPEKKFIEFQIRTEQMHEENERGIAAHWIYKQRGSGNSPASAKKLTEEIAWIRQLRNWQEKFYSPDRDPQEFIQAMKVDFFKDRIFVITPRGDVIDLPVGSTPIDFAYQIHSEIGDACAGAKVNDQLVSLDHKLKSGDVVHILIQKNKKPSEDWIKFAQTALAKEHIKTALRRKTSGLNMAKKPGKTEIRMVVQDRLGLIKDISSIMSRSHIKILSMQTTSQSGNKFPTIKIQCEILPKNKIEKLMLKLKEIKEVREISYQLI